MAKRVYQKNHISAAKLGLFFNESSVQYIFTASNAPHRAIVVSNRSGNYQLYAVDFASGFSRQITKKKSGALFGSISPDGDYVFALKDKQGGERGNFEKVPFTGGKSINISPNIAPYFSYSVGSSDSGKTLCFTAATRNNNCVFVVKINKNTPRAKKIYSSNSSLSESICSPDGKYVCVAKASPQTKLNTLLLLSPVENGHALRSQPFDSIIPLSFSKKSKTPKVMALARKNNWLRPIFYDFKKKKAKEIKHNNFRGDVWVLRWDEELDEMILCDVYRARHKLYRYNTKTKKLERIGPKTGSFNFHFNSAARLSDGSLIIKWHDFNTSPRLIRVYAPDYQKCEEISEWSGNLKSRHEVRSAWALSSDKERVHMWVVRPAKKTKKRLPFVIDIHGGPHGVVGNEFSPEAQAWLANGFGYCAVNYRGSIGFGKKFERKLYGNPGRWEVEDVVAARSWLVQNGYADPDNVVLYGWSWGGYATLLALGKYPALWSRGIAGAAIADCAMQYEDEPAYFKSQDKEMFGGTPETAPARYARSSPITYAKNMQAPVFLLHGKNDVRCPPRQIKHFVDKLKKLNKAVSIEWFTSGHTGEFTDTSLRIRLMKKVLRFATTKKKRPSRTQVS